MRTVKIIFGAIDKINEFFAKLFSWAILLLVLTMTYEVISRYVFRAPTMWSYDMSYFLSSLMIIMGMAYTLRIKGHVNIDIIYNRFPPRVRALVDVIFTLFLFFPLWYIITAAIIPHVAHSWEIQERSWVGTWLPIKYPFKTWIAVGIVMLFLQGIVEFIRNLYVAITGGERP